MGQRDFFIDIPGNLWFNIKLPSGLRSGSAGPPLWKSLDTERDLLWNKIKNGFPPKKF